MPVYTFLGGTWSSTASWAGGVVPPNADNSYIIFNSASGNAINTVNNTSCGGIRFDGTTASTDAQFASFPPATDYYAGTFNLNNLTFQTNGTSTSNKIYFSPNMRWIHGGVNGRLNLFISGNHGNLRFNGMTFSIQAVFANTPKTLEDDMVYNYAGSEATLLSGFQNNVVFQGLSGTRKNIYLHFWGASQSTRNFNVVLGQGPAKFSLGQWMNIIYGEHNGTLTGADFRFAGTTNVSTNTENSTIFDFGVGTMSGTVFDLSSVVEYKSGNLVDSSVQFRGDYNSWWVHSSTGSYTPSFYIGINEGLGQDVRMNAVGHGPFVIENLYLQPRNITQVNSIFTIGGATNSSFPTLPVQSWSASNTTIGSETSFALEDSSRMDFRMGRGTTFSTNYIFTNWSVLRSTKTLQQATWNVSTASGQPVSGATPSFSVNRESVIYNTSIQNINLIGPETVYGLTAMTITGNVGDYQDGLPSGGGTGSTETSHTFIL